MRAGPGGFDGKSIIVTGGGSGIARAAALRAAAGGARLTIADIDEAAGQAVAVECRSAGGRAQYVRTDVSRAEDVERMVQAAVEVFGGLDAAFNNAGVQGAHTPFSEVTLAAFERSNAVNYTGIFLCMKYELAAMAAGGGGAIVNTSSAGVLTFMGTECDYVGAKCGIIGLTRSAAFEYAPRGVRVNAILPGATRTRIVAEAFAGRPEMKAAVVARQPIGRMIEPEEVAAAALWLLSDEASAITGVCLPVDGGFALA